MKEPNKFHNYETEKITRKASDVAEYIELLVHSPEIIMHDALMLFSEGPLIYASSCVMILGGRTEQLNIIAGFLPCHWLYE